MAITNHERVGKALELLKQGLGPFVKREVQAAVESGTLNAHGLRKFAEDPKLVEKPIEQWDSAGLLKLMWSCWNEAFRQTLGHAERSLVSELRENRNKWAHQESFSSDDAYRVLDSTERLLTAVSASEAAKVEEIKSQLLRVKFDEQSRGERRRKTGKAIESAAVANLKPWREVVTPHPDVASGKYEQAEFAADLWQVHIGEGAGEYRDPVEFFRRTYLTESLQRLLTGAIQRLSGKGSDPVVQLQTNFGGGKTHSMLALYHLFSGVAPGELPGVETILQAAEAVKVPSARRIVLVGNKISPGNPVTKPDDTIVRTLWGELAWQLGGKEAYARIASDDANATNPGDALRQMFIDYGPCLILIDEWVAYARQLHDQSDLPAGGFETQFTFAQALTESAKLAGNCLLVISLPASDTSGSPHATADDVEVGGQRGREALDRLRNVVGRIESSWRPASAEEGFEIVRRRLFDPFAEQSRFKDRDVVARAFADFYRTQHQEFPLECRDADYEKRIKAAYPIHPEIFDRLYSDWSTLVKFQRTRGVLRLMAAVIYSLWEKGDQNPLILPANIAIDDSRVQFELTRYLSDNWVPVIEKDVDGANSLPLRTDSDMPNLGRFAACRRVARTIYLGSAPTVGAAHRGIEDRRVKLGCLMPGESPTIFGDALRRLAASATYLYQDGSRYWYSTQPTVTKIAEDRANQLSREPEKVLQELNTRLRAGLRDSGDFSRIHPLPQSGQDVPDDTDARLVVLDPEHRYSKGGDSSAEAAARTIFESRGNSPRLYRNSLVFLAADQSRMQDLDEALRRYLAWESILTEREQLNLSPHQTGQAQTQRDAATSAVEARIPEAYQWLLVPVQDTPQSEVTWQAMRLTSQGALAVRASKKLRGDELLLTRYAASRLQMDLDRVPLWRGDHVAVSQLAEDFAKYLYLPRLQNSRVLLGAIDEGVRSLTWERDSFAFADSHDEEVGRYRGLRVLTMINLPDTDSPGLLVKSEIAKQQIEAETAAEPPPSEVQPDEDVGAGKTGGDSETDDSVDSGVKKSGPRRFHGSVTLGSERVGRDAGQIAAEVVSHLEGLVKAKVIVTLEIEAEIPEGAPENVVRTVTENARTLKFSSHGFEQE